MTLLLILAALAAVSCRTAAPPPQPRPATLETDRLPTPALLDLATKAWMQQRYDQSELYYQRLLDRKDLQSRDMVYERYIASAIENRHYGSALQGLTRQAEQRPAVRDTPEWNRGMLRALEGLGDKTRLQAHLAAMLANGKLPPADRGVAGARLGWQYWDDGKRAEAVDAMDRVANLNIPADARQPVKDAFSQGLENLGERELNDLATAIPAQKEYVFPFWLVTYRRSMRESAAGASQWPQSWQSLRRLEEAATGPEKEAVANRLTALESKYGAPRFAVALALPLSGRFANLGWSVLRGAEAARHALAAMGSDVTIHAVNTEQPDWLRQIDALPPEVIVVGGPLQVSSFQQAQQAGLTSRRAMFTFLQGLGDAVEGRDAWRFFGSQEDQARALVTLARQDLGISRFAVLYPQEKFGTRMFQIFSQEVAAQGGEVTASESYPPSDPAQWGKIVAHMLRVPARLPEKTVVVPPSPPFDAVFLADGWAQSQIIAPQLYFYDAENQLLLGPELWSQAIAQSGSGDFQYFQLGACPGAWLDDATLPGVRALRAALSGGDAPDFWTALGYDFVNLVANMGPFPSGADPDLINERLQSAQSLEWALAPISWDARGVASQSLYLFRPAQGLPPVAQSDLAARYAKAQARHQERIETARARLEEQKKQQ